MTELSLFCWFLGAEEAHDHLPEALPNRSIQMCGVQRPVRLCWDSHFGLQHPEDARTKLWAWTPTRTWGGHCKESRKEFCFFYSFLFPSPIYLGLFWNLCFLLNTSNVQQRVGFEECKTKTMTKGQCTWKLLLFQFVIQGTVQIELFPIF